MYLVQYVILVTWIKLKTEISMFKYGQVDNCSYTFRVTSLCYIKGYLNLRSECIHVDYSILRH